MYFEMSWVKILLFSHFNADSNNLPLKKIYYHMVSKSSLSHKLYLLL